MPSPPWAASCREPIPRSTPRGWRQSGWQITHRLELLRPAGREVVSLSFCCSPGAVAISTLPPRRSHEADKMSLGDCVGTPCSQQTAMLRASFLQPLPSALGCDPGQRWVEHLGSGCVSPQSLLDSRVGVPSYTASCAALGREDLTKKGEFWVPFWPQPRICPREAEEVVLWPGPTRQQGCGPGQMQTLTCPSGQG